MITTAATGCISAKGDISIGDTAFAFFFSVRDVFAVIVFSVRYVFAVLVFSGRDAWISV